MQNLTPVPGGRGDEHSSECPCPPIFRADLSECCMHLGGSALLTGCIQILQVMLVEPFTASDPGLVRKFLVIVKIQSGLAVFGQQRFS